MAVNPVHATYRHLCEKYLGGDGLSIRKLGGNLGLFSQSLRKNFLARLGFQLGHYAPKSLAQFLCRTIMGVACWERDLSVKWEQL